jgi:hypothetical protein
MSATKCSPVSTALFKDSGLVTAALIAGGIVLWMSDLLVERIEWQHPPVNGQLART